MSDLDKANVVRGGLLSPALGIALSVAVATGGLFSPENAAYWLICAIALGGVFLILAGDGGEPVLLTIAGLFWVEVASDILSADLSGNPLERLPGGAYRPYVVSISLVALLVMSLGMRLGLGRPRRGDANPMIRVRFDRALLLYAATVPISGVATYLGSLVPSLSQPLLAFGKLKLVALYILASCILRDGRGLHWLVCVLIGEIVIGLGGFISSYQPAVITVLVAVASSQGFRPGAGRILAMVAGAALLVWVSLLWTAMKPEYRAWASGGSRQQIVTRSVSERIAWMSDWLLSDKLDVGEAFAQLVGRLGYTTFYALAAQRAEQGQIQQAPQRWSSAIIRVVTPRAFFDKEAINDTAVTTMLTGVRFSRSASVSIGYVAEAHIDFGFPLMLLPIFLLGLMLGLTARYFLGRKVPPEVGQAFAIGALVFTFEYGANIDKQFGGFAVGFIALALVLRFAGPPLTRWLEGGALPGPRAPRPAWHQLPGMSGGAPPAGA
jgi:hypothetical protein